MYISNRPLWTSDRVVREPTVFVTPKPRELVFPHPELGDGQHAAQREDVSHMALPLFRWPQVNAGGATIHEVLVAAAQRAR